MIDTRLRDLQTRLADLEHLVGQLCQLLDELVQDQSDTEFRQKFLEEDCK